jgi:hypothetical protein
MHCQSPPISTDPTDNDTGNRPDKAWVFDIYAGRPLDQPLKIGSRRRAMAEGRYKKRGADPPIKAVRAK